MIDATTEAGMLCGCGHPALTHLHKDADETCTVAGCACVAFTGPLVCWDCGTPIVWNVDGAEKPCGHAGIMVVTRERWAQKGT